MTENTNLSRRHFLQNAGVVAGAGLIACSGLAYIGTRREAIDPLELTCSPTAGQGKVLVAYATMCGSTAEVAQRLGEVCCSLGNAGVDVRPAADVHSLDGYSAVIVGSAVRYGNWLVKGMEFVENNRETLLRMPVAFFSVHMQNTDDSVESRKAREDYTGYVRAIVNPQVEAFFPGVIDLQKLTLFERLVVSVVGAQQGDRRDWGSIEAWGRETFPGLV